MATDETAARGASIDPPQIVHTEDVPIAYIPITVARAQIREVMEPGIGEVMAAIAAQGQTPAGPWFSHHLRMDPALFDFEICVPVAAPITPVGRVRPGTLAAAMVMRTEYRGPYEGLGTAWEEFRNRITAAGHEMRPDLWECYLVGPESGPDPAGWRTQLNQPLAE